VTIFSAKGISDPTGITSGPDCNLWFTNSGNNTIGRITTSGVVTIFHRTKSDQIADPVAIATGSDGALWFTNFRNNSIGRITTKGKVKAYSSPPGVRGQISEPNAITAGPDDALWFTNYFNDTIEKITTSGGRTDFRGHPKIGYPTAITEGSDGNLWFTNIGFVGRLTPEGQITDFTGKIGNSAHLQGITPGPGGNLWFTISNFNQIGKISTSGTVSIYG
jgi:virginiamycin B lyase